MGNRSSKAATVVEKTARAVGQQQHPHSGLVGGTIPPVEAAVDASASLNMSQVPKVPTKWNEKEGKYDIDADVLREIEKWSTQRIAENKKNASLESSDLAVAASTTLNRIEGDSLVDSQLENREIVVGRFDDAQLINMLTELRDSKKSIEEFSTQYGISVVTVTSLLRYVRVPVLTPDPDKDGGFLAS